MLKKHINKIKRLIAENWRQLNLLTLLAPFLFAVGIAFFLLSDQVAEIEGIGPHTFKQMLEKVAFYILVPAIVFAYLRFCIERSIFFLWTAAIIGSLICREVHWDWSHNGVFILLVILMCLGYMFYDRLRPQISSSTFVNLFVAAVLCYFIANFLLDHNWARISRAYRSDIRFRKSLEEFMEIMGHAIMAAIVLFTPANKNEKYISNSEDSD